MTLHRLLDAIFYALVNFIAYIPLVVYPFRNRFTFSKKVSYGILGALCVGFVWMTICVVNGMPAYWIPIITLLVTTVVLKIGIKEHLGKTLMTFLIEYNNASFVTVMAKALEHHFFPNPPHTMYCWTHSIFILVGLIFVYIFDGIYSFKYYNDIILIPNENKTWNYIWLTPMSYFVFWFMYIYNSESYVNGTPERMDILILLILISLCSFITYYIILQLAFSEQEKARLLYQDNMNQSQYKNWNRRIEETRRLRHDLRHHMLILQTMGEENDLAGMKEYLSQFSGELNKGSTTIYCSHYGTNALLTYYAEKAREENFVFDAHCVMPEQVLFTDMSLTVVFGNLIENAMNACRKVKERTPEIHFRCEYRDERMVLKISNTTDEMPKQDAYGRYLSTSHSGYGIGIESIRSVVDKYHGYMNILAENGMFTVSIVMSSKDDFEKERAIE